MQKRSELTQKISGGWTGRRDFLAMAVAALAAVAGPAAAQQAYPQKPIRIVVPFSPGGPIDVVARTVAERMSVTLGQKVFVENKPGASNQIGVDTVLNAPADGYTVLLSTQSGAIVGLTNQNFNRDLKKELVGVTALVKYPILLVTKADLPVKTFPELLAYSKANPGKLNFGAQGSSDLLAVEALKAQTGLDATIIRYGGGGPVSVALVAGQIDFATFALSSVKQFIGSGKIKALAVLGPDRLEEYPDVPPITTVGAPGYEFSSWSGLLVRHGTSEPIIRKLHDAAVAALSDPAVEKRLKDAGLFKVSMGSDEFTKYWSSEIDRWTAIARKANFKPE